MVGSGHFDFVKNLAAQMPMRVISMLLGIPENDQESIRDDVDEAHRVEPGQTMSYHLDNFSGDLFATCIDWRVEHPSDDLMTMLLTIEFEDETGTTRRLSRETVPAGSPSFSSQPQRTATIVGLRAGTHSTSTGRSVRS